MTVLLPMNTTMIASLFLCVCFFNIVYSQNFIEVPRDQTVREGETVLFRCIIHNLQMNQNVYWQRLSTRHFITINRMVSSGAQQRNRLSILGNGNRGEFFLQIRNVELSDAGIYRCGYAIPNMAFTFRSAELIVLRPPNPGSPICDVSPSDVAIDNVASLTCRSEGGHPPASLTWRLGDTILTDPKESRNVLAVVVSAEHNGREFICEATSPAFDERRFCTVKLLSIRPDVRVEPPLGTAPVGGRIVFTCVAFGLPAIVRYEWLFDNEPVDGIERIEISSDNRTLIVNDIDIDDDGTPVHCTATTTFGLSGTSGASISVDAATTFTFEPTMNATDFNATAGLPEKPSSVIIAIIVVSVIVGQVLIVIVVYIIHRYVNRMMKKRKSKRHPKPVVKAMDTRHPPPRADGTTDMGENIYVGGVKMDDGEDIDPETGTPNVHYNAITDASFDSSFSMGEGIYSQGTTSPPVGVALTAAVPLASRPPSNSPPSPIYSNATELDEGNREPVGRFPPPSSAPPLSPTTSSESPYGYDEVPFVEAEKEPRRPPPPNATPPRPPVVITSPPPNKPPPRAPADKRQSQPGNEYTGLNPNRPESRYLSLRHYDEAYADQVLQEGEKLGGGYNPYDKPVIETDGDHRPDEVEHDDDGYIYELPPTDSSPDEVYDVPPDAIKREYTIMVGNVPPKPN